MPTITLSLNDEDIDRIASHLANKLAESQAQPLLRQNNVRAPLLLGMTDAARLLGVSRTTLWRMIGQGRLKRLEILPGSFRVRRVDLEALVANVGE